MKNKVFHPQYISPRFKLIYKGPNSLFFNRPILPFKKYIAGKLHYLSYHAPLPLQKKWKPVWNKFWLKHQGVSDRQSYRFMLSLSSNKYL